MASLKCFSARFSSTQAVNSFFFSYSYGTCLTKKQIHLEELSRNTKLTPVQSVMLTPLKLFFFFFFVKVILKAGKDGFLCCA